MRKTKRSSFFVILLISSKCKLPFFKRDLKRRIPINDIRSERNCSSSLTWKSFRSPDAESPNIWALPNPRSTDGYIRLKVPRNESCSVPEQDFTFITALIEEHKEMTAQWILLHKRFCHHRKFMVTASHISRLSINEYLNG